MSDAAALATKKTPSYLAKPLADRSAVQAVVGEAEARLGAARAYLYEALTEVWDKALQGYLIDMPGKHSLQRHFRDVHTITQHAFVSASRYESGGQYFLGVPIEWLGRPAARGSGVLHQRRTRFGCASAGGAHHRWLVAKP